VLLRRVRISEGNRDSLLARARSRLAPVRRLSLDRGKSRARSRDMGCEAWEERARDTEFHVAKHGIHGTMIITAPATSDHVVTIRCSGLSFAARRATASVRCARRSGSASDYAFQRRGSLRGNHAGRHPGRIPRSVSPPGSQKRINRGSGRVH